MSSNLASKVDTISADDYKDLIAAIDRKVKLIDSIESGSPKDYFSQLADFYNFITKNPTLLAALEIIHSNYDEEVKVLDELRATVKTETEEAFKNLRDIALKNDLVSEADLRVIEEYFGDYEQYRDDKKQATKEHADLINQTENKILAEIKDYYAFLAGAAQSLSGTPLESVMVGAVESIVRAYRESGHSDVIQKYVNLEKSSTSDEMVVSKYNVSSTDTEFRERKKALDRKLEPSPWHAAEMIQLVPLTMYDYHDHWNQLRATHNMAEMMGLGGYIGAMDKIMEGRKPEIEWFNVKEYQLYLRRLVDALFDVLSNMRKASQQAGPDFKSGESVAFENDNIFFKLGDGSWDSIDLSNAPELLKVFKTFWELRKRRLSEELFASEVVIRTYQEVNNDEVIDKRRLATLISNFRQTKIYPKPNLKERIILSFDNKTKQWRFKLS